MYKLSKENHCKGKGLICTIIFSSAKLSGNSILKFKVSVEHSENRISSVPKTRLGLIRSAKFSIQQIRNLRTLTISAHVKGCFFFQFLDNKTNITLQLLKTFWPDGKMADQLLLAVLYELILKFIKNEKFAPHSLI